MALRAVVVAVVRDRVETVGVGECPIQKADFFHRWQWQN
jgi:hypothetical protein